MTTFKKIVAALAVALLSSNLAYGMNPAPQANTSTTQPVWLTRQLAEARDYVISTARGVASEVISDAMRQKFTAFVQQHPNTVTLAKYGAYAVGAYGAVKLMLWMKSATASHIKVHFPNTYQWMITHKNNMNARIKRFLNIVDTKSTERLKANVDPVATGLKVGADLMYNVAYVGPNLTAVKQTAQGVAQTAAAAAKDVVKEAADVSLKEQVQPQQQQSTPASGSGRRLF